MRFKISLQNQNGHKKLVTCVAWSSNEDVYSCGEDHSLICWHLEGGVAHPTIITEFPSDFYPTDMQWHPRPIQTKNQSLEVLLISTADGKFHLVNKTGRIEKSVESHKGATTKIEWSQDGTAFLTTGEDGLIKIWSRSGMLRSTLIRTPLPILSLAWSPDSTTVLYTQGTYLLFQSLNSKSKPHKWQASDGLILVVVWNRNHGLIVSGGEDCRYKVWDSKGTNLYNSGIGEHPVTSIGWCFSGDYFAVGSFNTIKLCDRTGWSHSLEKLNTGSIYSIGWSSDGTQVAMACGTGTVVTGHVIDRRLEWNNYEASLVKRKVIQIRDIGNEIRETLEISDRVVLFEFGFDHLVVITPLQCHIYSTNNWNTPAIFDLKTPTVSAIIIAEKHFLLIEWNVVTLYSYQGRLIGIPKWKNQTQEPLYPPCISLCCDTLVIRDQSNYKSLRVFEISYNKPIVEIQPYAHDDNIYRLALNHMGSTKDRQLAFIDRNKDLFLLSIRLPGYLKICKIASMAQNISWATDVNVLAGMLDSTLSVWLCPNCVYHTDHKITRKTRIDKENSEYGKQPSIVNVRNGIVTVRRGDGSIVVTSFYSFFTSLHDHAINNKWKEALSLCRIAQNETLWTCLAIMATDNKELTTAEESYAAIRRYDKVDYIRYIEKLTNPIEKIASLSLLSGDFLTAEGILLQNALIPQAIRSNLSIYNWTRALELSQRHKQLTDEVLTARKNYLKLLNKIENNPNFIRSNNNNNNIERSQE